MDGTATIGGVGQEGSAMVRALRSHWPEYSIEALALGLFMVSAGVFGTLLEAPGSPLHLAIPNGFLRQILMGAAMGLTAVSIFYSPWGKRSGAHMNPAVTLTFLRLGKVEPWDAVFYVGFQLAGGVLGVAAVTAVFGDAFTAPPVASVATVPGPDGAGIAFLAETTIAALMMGAVLVTSNRAATARFTGLLAGTLVALFIVFEGPLSGMSINPARTVASALPSGIWTDFWVYLTAPLLGMLLAAEVYGALAHPVLCAKFQHEQPGEGGRCIFRCGYCRHSDTAST